MVRKDMPSKGISARSDTPATAPRSKYIDDGKKINKAGWYIVVFFGTGPDVG